MGGCASEPVKSHVALTAVEKVAANEKSGNRSDLSSPPEGLKLSDMHKIVARASEPVQSAKELTANEKSGYASDLSLAAYKTAPPLDCVLAVTQGALNAEMLRYLDEQQFQEVSMCYMSDLDSEKLHPVSLEHVKSKTGVDPFAVPNDARSPDKNFELLLEVSLGKDAKGRDLYFEGGIKYRGGLPDTPPSKLPQIVVLPEQMNGRITYNMTFAELEIVGFNHGRVQKYVNVRQSESPHPWVFSFDVDLLTSPIPADFPNVPADVLERYKQLLEDAGAGAFGLARLHLLLSTAAMYAQPTITGLPENFEPTWKLMSKFLVDGYFEFLKLHGDPVFSYQFTADKVVPVKAFLPMTKLSHVTAPYHTAALGGTTPAGDKLSCLAYLCTAQLDAKNAPPAVAFPWNWVVADDYRQISGAVSIKREHFVNFMRESLGQPINHMCYDNHVSVEETIGNCVLGAFFTLAPFEGNRWVVLNEPHRVEGLGLKVLKMEFRSESSASDKFWPAETKFTLKSELTGGVYFDGTRITIELHAINYMYLWHDNLAKSTTILNGNYYDKYFRYEFDLMVSSYGTIKVSKPDPVVIDKSKPFNPDTDTKAWFADFNEITDYVIRYAIRLNEALDTGLNGLSQVVYDNVNSFNRFVYPGSDSFSFHDVFFSGTCDLVSQLNYSSTLMKKRLAKSYQLTATPVTTHVLANKAPLVFGRRLRLLGAA